ncbi:FAD-binding and (Fe-S)-binding domain-containing protein [uncultured Microbacterium sp.]|uniref:FAD-binding and (Fe-S)-binding domain-containing protein n=1 Tax=uncultured Microbacterium sp. TaxID=191216 RepID=UPI0035C9C0D3
MPAVLSNTLEGLSSTADVTVKARSIDRFAMAHDASHYLQIPELIATPATGGDVAEIFRASHTSGRPLTFRSGGTSLSGQAISDSILVDTRAKFQRIAVLDGGERVRVQPGATVRQTNAHLLRHGRRLGPDPASEIACTIGGVIANNSSGMACGITENTYRTLESMTFVLPSGTIIDTAETDADEVLRTLEPDLYSGLATLRRRIHDDPTSVAEIVRQYSMKNTMGYGLNSFVDFERPIDMLAHLIIGSEGTLAFVAEAVFRTVEVLPHAATGLLVFPSLLEATRVLPELVAVGLATVELMDATSLAVAKLQPDCPTEVASLDIDGNAALLVEFQARTAHDLDEKKELGGELFRQLDLSTPAVLTSDSARRAALWHTRKGLYTTVAGARPSGTTALLEDIAVPVEKLFGTCESLTALFDEHGYEDSVIFGHAKDGNIHFMLNERFDDPHQTARYRQFTEDLVDLVLGSGGSLKAEHGTGRIMAPFVARQFGAELYDVMTTVKTLCDPTGLLNPGVLLSDDPDSYLADLKRVPSVENEVDRCVECGYCEPACPSKTLTLTPRQRIALRREMQIAEAEGNVELLRDLQDDYEYDGVETCAVDGMCKNACPVDINTGDLVRRLRQESRGRLEQGVWDAAARQWGAVTVAGGVAMTAAKVMPSLLPTMATKVGRAILGHETVPLYDRALPGGGSRRPKGRIDDSAQAVYFAACINTMFGPAEGSGGVSHAFLELCERASVRLAIPDDLPSLCCGTPWKSKGYSVGYEQMASQVLPALQEASRNGQLPIVCDAASCTEGLETMRAIAAEPGSPFTDLVFMDAVEFVDTVMLDRLTVTAPAGSVALHHTCSTVDLGINGSMDSIARFISDDVYTPVDWGCCAFAGDRGMLHPELTAAATEREAHEIASREFDHYASANRTCEIGMSRATGQNYRHLLELLEEATRPVSPVVE